LSFNIAEILYVSHHLGALKLPVYSQSSVSSNLIIESFTIKLTSFKFGVAYTCTIIFFHSSISHLSLKGASVIFLNLGNVSSIFIITLFEAPIFFQSESSINACITFSHVFKSFTSFSKIHSEFDIVLNSLSSFITIRI
jgi:hypothetical protein